PDSANATARLSVVVVLATPPFWLANAMTLACCSTSARSRSCRDPYAPPFAGQSGTPSVIPLLDHRLVYVSGKGGVGKSTVAAALGLAAVRRRRRHGVAVLAAPRTFADAARVGPIARHGTIIDSMLSDPARTAVVAVTTPEELPVNETLALRQALREQVGLDLTLVVVNAVRPDRFTEADAARLRAVDGAAGRIALAAPVHARAPRAQLARLRR